MCISVLRQLISIFMCQERALCWSAKLSQRRLGFDQGLGSPDGTCRFTSPFMLVWQRRRQNGKGREKERSSEPEPSTMCRRLKVVRISSLMQPLRVMKVERRPFFGLLSLYSSPMTIKTCQRIKFGNLLYLNNKGPNRQTDSRRCLSPMIKGQSLWLNVNKQGKALAFGSANGWGPTARW